MESNGSKGYQTRFFTIAKNSTIERGTAFQNVMEPDKLHSESESRAVTGRVPGRVPVVMCTLESLRRYSLS